MSGISKGALTRAIETIKPRVLGRTEALPVHNVRMSDIGGLDNAKKALTEMLVLPALHPDKYRKYGAQPPRGLLLFGPPGTGKTMLAKAVAGEAGVGFIDIDISGARATARPGLGCGVWGLGLWCMVVG